MGQVILSVENEIFYPRKDNVPLEILQHGNFGLAQL